MKYLKTYENIQFKYKYIIISYKKSDPRMTSLLEISKSKLTARTHKTHYHNGQTLTFKKGDTLYKFYQTYFIIPDDYKLLYETDNYKDALENFELSNKIEKYNL